MYMGTACNMHMPEANHFPCDKVRSDVPLHRNYTKICLFGIAYIRAADVVYGSAAFIYLLLEAATPMILSSFMRYCR